MNKNKNISKGKTRRPNKKVYDRNKVEDQKFEKEGAETSKKYNDPMWYAKNEQMLRDAASYSYNNPIGMPLPKNLWQGGPSTGAGLAANPEFVPSLMSIKVLPTIGVSEDSSSPANLAANNIYAYVRYQNSGAKNYDQADLMLYLLAMDSIYACWNWMKRIYGYMQMYSQYNMTLPRVFATADRISFDTFQSSLADFRLFLNRTAAQISSFCVPAVMPFFIRHSWMFSNIYKDSDSNKAQMYMFNPIAFYMYSETSSTNGGELIPMPITDLTSNTFQINSLSVLETYLTNLINAVAYSEDIGVMSGDILKAYGQDRLFKLTPVEPDYSVIPVYNEEVLNQIHNSTIVPTQLNETNQQYYKVTQDSTTGYLKWKPIISVADSFIPPLQPSGFLLNMPWDDVTPANTMVGTRLTAQFKISGASGSRKVELVTCGSEIVTNYEVIYPYQSGTGVAQTFNRDMYWVKDVLVSNITGAIDVLSQIARFSNFDWHPLLSFVVNATGSTYSYCGTLGDINNYTYLTVEDLTKLHLTAVMSEFNIPQLGSF